LSPLTQRWANVSSKLYTTVRMQTHTSHANVSKAAIGYVKVSTIEQAADLRDGPSVLRADRAEHGKLS